MEASSVRAVLFVKDLSRAVAFYVGALGMTRVSGDNDHAILECDGFELVVHQIPKQIAETIVIAQPPIRRVWGARARAAEPLPGARQKRFSRPGVTNGHGGFYTSQLAIEHSMPEWRNW